MSDQRNAQTRDSASPVEATLTLGEAQLAGEIAGVVANGIEIGAMKVLRGARTSGKLKFVAGTPGELLFNIGEGQTHALNVKIARAAGRTLTLEFADPGSPEVTAAVGELQAAAGARPTPEPTDEATGKKLLSMLHVKSLGQLDPLISKFTHNLQDHLLDLSASATLATGQDRYYTALNEVKRHGADVSRDFLGKINDYFVDVVPAKKKSSGTDAGQGHSLDLVDLSDFEDDLAVDRMINIGEELHSVALECLILRVAELVQAEPRTVRLPVHVEQLSRALQASFASLDISHEVMLDIFELFIDSVIRELDNLYQYLNHWLATEGVRPGLEELISREGSQLNKPQGIVKSKTKRKAAEAEADGESDNTTDPGEGAGLAEATEATEAARNAGGQDSPPAQAAAEQPQTFNPDNLYRSVIDALNFRREADQLQSTGASSSESTASAAQGFATPNAERPAPSSAEAGNLAGLDTVAKALDRLQQDKTVREELLQTASLRSYLEQHSDKIAGISDTDGLAPQSLNQIDLVDNLFGSIKSHLDVTQELKPALGSLQIPLAKLALQEPQFFLDRDHAARGVLDKLAQLASSANYPNKALEGRVASVVEDIVENYADDSTVFNRVLGTVDKLVEQQERALTRNRERVVKTQDGQEKLARAQDAVARVINARIRPPHAPAALVQLVDNGWRDLLVLTHIKEGTDSRIWKDHVKSLDLLSLWLIERLKGDVDDSILVQRGLEAEPFLDMLRQQISTALPTNVGHEPVIDTLRDVLAGREAVETVEIESSGEDQSPRPAEVRRKIESLPRLRRWVRRVEQMEVGTWLSYRDSNGTKRRMQLAWMSETKDRYIFVNERGQKMADLSAVKLARQLSKGVQPPAPSEKLSLVDRSMYETLEHVQKSLSFENNHDTLTRLINRRTFEAQVDRALRHAQRKRSTHAMLYIDIDQFNLVNDVYDRVNGDLVLMEFARLLSQLHGKKVSSARLQEDEFGVLLVDRTVAQAVQVADKIREDIESSSVEVEGEKVIFTVSIGITPILEYSPDVGDIIEEARSAVRQAKDAGRNQVVVFEEDAQRKVDYKKEQLAAIQRLEETLETDRFVLRAQPIIQTSVVGDREATKHFEILLGLERADGELESPQEFILAAERYGYMTQVDRWVVRETFSWMSELMDAQKVVPDVSINVSGHSITDDSFMDYLLEQISEFGVGTNRLCFEITETGTISNLVKAADFLRAFRNIGCKFSIDDFGTGLASHNYLRELPVDYVKIDGVFITNIHINRNDYAMARSINDLAHFLGQETIAESVEHDEIITKLEEIGVDYLQGWGIGKPKRLAEVAETLSTIEK